MDGKEPLVASAVGAAVFRVLDWCGVAGTTLFWTTSTVCWSGDEFRKNKETAVPTRTTGTPKTPIFFISVRRLIFLIFPDETRAWD